MAEESIKITCVEQLRNSPHSLLNPKYWSGPLRTEEIALGLESEDLSTGSPASWVTLDQSLPFLGFTGLWRMNA